MSMTSNRLLSVVVSLVEDAAEGQHLSRSCHDRLVGASREERCSATALSSLYQTRGVSATLRLPTAAMPHSAAYIKREAFQPRSRRHEQLGCAQQPISNAGRGSHTQAAISS